ncbi:hypothetical protein V1514DRAFT_326034 [Lipomyces japonicus]|uniref:uncharacterized protein n=1 Tax=Lipomyces japonicus TaxID=56871 RepID=UPI0034CF3F8C
MGIDNKHISPVVQTTAPSTAVHNDPLAKESTSKKSTAKNDSRGSVLQSKRHTNGKDTIAKRLSRDSFDEFERNAIEEARQAQDVAESAIKNTHKQLAAKSEWEEWSPISSGHVSPSQKSTVAPRLSFGQIAGRPGSGNLNEVPGENELSNSPESSRHISSDDYFERNKISKEEECQIKSRLHDFDNATSIASSDLFGENQDQNEDYSNLDYVAKAKEIAMKLAVTADDEIESIREYIGSKASKASKPLSALWGTSKR